MANIKIIRSKKSVEETEEMQELYPQEEVTENLSEWANSTYMVVCPPLRSNSSTTGTSSPCISLLLTMARRRVTCSRRL